MRGFTILFVSTLVLGAFASAQMEPKPLVVPNTEIFGGYAYQHAGTSGISAVTGGAVSETSTNLNGFAIEFSHYPHGKLGFTFDLARTSNGAVDSTGIMDVRTSYMAGPSYRLHGIKMFTPSIHALAGIDRDHFTVPQVGTVINYQNNDFAAAGGVAFDGNLSRHLAVRIAQVDYLYTHHYSTNQSSFRYTGGVVARF